MAGRQGPYWLEVQVLNHGRVYTDGLGMLLAMIVAVARIWRPRFNSATGWALRVSGVAALAIGGVAAGRGVVAVSAERAAPAAYYASESGARPAPAFGSTIRSWVAPAATTRSAAAVPAVVATAYTVSVARSRSDVAPSLAAQTDDGAHGASLPRIDVPASGVQLVPAAAAATATPPVQVPSATPAPTTAQAEPAAPSIPVAEPANPADAVRSFYALLEQGNFDDATGLWTAHMRGAYPPAENVYGRFARTQALTVRRADVVALDAAAGRATVAVDLTEVVGPPAATRRYVGTWQVVRGPSGWLLDQPNLQPS